MSFPPSDEDIWAAGVGHARLLCVSNCLFSCCYPLLGRYRRRNSTAEKANTPMRARTTATARPWFQNGRQCDLLMAGQALPLPVAWTSTEAHAARRQWPPYRACQGRLVCRRKTINRPLNRGQTFGRDEVWMRGDGTIWQVYRLVIFGFFNKRATHNNSAFPVVTGRSRPEDAPPA
jgi:hypothetical protein